MPTPGTGTGPGFDSPLPAGGATVNQQGVQIQDVTVPPASGFGDVNSLLAAYTQATNSAQSQYDQAKAAYDQANNEYQRAQSEAAADPFNGAANVTAARDVLQNANNNWQRAGAVLERAQTQAATGLRDYQTNKNTLPGEQALLSKQADYYDAQATVAKANAAVISATDPVAKQNADIALQQAQGAAQTAQAALSQVQAGATAALLPGQVAEQTATTGLTGAQTALTGAQAGQVAAQTPGIVAQQGATLAGTQAATGLTGAQTGLTGAQAGGVQATTAQTQATTAATTQGTLASLDAYAQAQRDAIAKGLITPEQASAALAARIAGTNVYQATQDAEKASMDRLNAAAQQRQQDIGLDQTKTSTFGNLASSGLNTLAGMNVNAPKGSTAGADAVGGYIQAMLGALNNNFQAPAPVQNPSLPPFLQQYGGQGGSNTVPQPSLPGPMPLSAPSPAAAAPPAPGPTSAGHTITINIGGSGDQSTPTLQGNASGTGGNGTGVSSTPFQAQGAQALGSGTGNAPTPALVQGMMPASPQDVINAHNQVAAKFGLPAVM